MAKKLFWITLALAVTLVATGCSLGQQETSAPKPAAQPAPAVAPTVVVEPTAVPAQPVSNTSAAINLPGDVEAKQKVNVVFPVPGRVQEVQANVGDRVTAGQVLAVLDHRTLDAQVTQMGAALKVANAQLALLQAPPDEADLAAAKAGVDAAEKAYKRMLAGPTKEDLIQAQAAVAQAEAGLRQAQAAYDKIAGLPNAGLMPQSLGLQQATIGYQTAKAMYDKVAKGATDAQIAQAYAGLLKARAGLKKLQDGPKPEQLAMAAAQILQAQSALDAMKVQRDNAYARAPMDGVISARHVVTGTYASPGLPAFTVVSVKTKIVIDAEESIAQAIRRGQEVDIQTNSVVGRSFKGIVTRISPTVDPKTRTRQITVEPLDGDSVLRPGMFATVSFRSREG
ncbi:MAG: HlyD family efflux transporter periplasmic adaptor subunit [Chloroflexi bacterium]|nr:HlyD family efflux transporter periplasmic adaptor subunit [Chloroflexota bacterium]